MRLTDRLLSGAARAYTDARIRMPSIGLLGEARMRAVLEVEARHRAAALELARRMDAREAGAAEAYGALVERALDEMRATTQRKARHLGLGYGVAAALHARFGDTDEPEYLDDPELDPAMRVRLLEHLDTFNVLLGSYRAFRTAMEPLLEERPEGGGPVRVLDLAAGHGGFALAAAREARTEGSAIEFTATDLKPEYLAIGEAVARREGLGVHFEVQDALDLSNRERDEFDIVICTQSLHHFPASMGARMFREAARVAGRGVVFVDICRSMVNAIIGPAIGLFRFGDKEYAHDAFVSLRRAYSPEELGLLARLGPESDGVEAVWMPPAHCMLRWTRRDGR